MEIRQYKTEVKAGQIRLSRLGQAVRWFNAQIMRFCQLGKREVVAGNKNSCKKKKKVKKKGKRGKK